MAAVGLAVILGVWGVVHFVGPSKTEPANTPAATATNAPAAQPAANAPAKTPSAKPVNPLEAQQKSALDKANQLVAANQLDQALQVLQPAAGLKGPLTADVQKRMADIETLRTENQQREAMVTADKRASAGDYKGAMDALQGAEKLGAAGSALGAEIKSKEAAIESAQKSATGKLWLQAQQEVDQGQFDAAKRDFRRAAAEDAWRASEAKRYVSEVIPSRQKEEDLYKQARQSAAGGDQQGLQRADDLLGRVAALNGPRKGDAQRMQADVESKLANLKEEMASRQLAALDAAGRASLKAGDFAGARQKAAQIRQAGGDPSGLLGDIGQAQFQQAVTDYNAAGSKDKSGLERARGEFQSIVRGNGAQGADAQQYVTDINKKLDALNAPPPSPPVNPAPTAAAPVTSAPAASARSGEYGSAGGEYGGGRGRGSRCDSGFYRRVPGAERGRIEEGVAEYSAEALFGLQEFV